MRVATGVQCTTALKLSRAEQRERKVRVQRGDRPEPCGEAHVEAGAGDGEDVTEDVDDAGDEEDEQRRARVLLPQAPALRRRAEQHRRDGERGAGPYPRLSFLELNTIR